MKTLVWSGFYSEEETLELVREAYPSDPHPGEAVAAELARKRQEERSWPEVTDCDLLDEVFRRLDAEGILCLHSAGYDQREGLEEIHIDYVQRGGVFGGVIGYCFYHGEDLERAIRGEGLLLAFGSSDGRDETGLPIGERIATRFEEAGLSVEWNRTMDKRLWVKPFCWQRWAR